MRESKPILTEEEMAEQIKYARPILVLDKYHRNNLKVWNLKYKKHEAWQNHLAEIEIDGKKALVNIADLKNALNFC